MSNCRILVVDDDDATQLLMSRYLESLGIDALVAGNGEQALELLKQHTAEISLVLIDIAMPGMNGYDLARAIRTELALTDLPLIALTARVGPEVGTKALAAGIDEVVAKPF